MPSCRVTNHTSQPLNICLKQVTALHFENSVQPGQTIKFRPGRVWFTLEALVDDGTKKSRYSFLKSAATIALLSVAVGAVAATAGAALLPEAAALEAIAAASVAGSYFAKGMTVTKMALLKNSTTIAKLSSAALPRAIDRLSAEIGGLSALQREVMSIIASPTLSSDVRHRAVGLLRSLHEAYSKDKASRSSAFAAGAGAAGATTSAPSSSSSEPNPSSSSASNTGRAEEKLEPLPLDPASAQDLEPGRADSRVEDKPVKTGEVLRVHKIFMDRRREFEIRVGEWGRMELWDAKEGKLWA
ncbi:hypothetical protein EHS25_004250 [Saitozyma podzolica]|uniref:Uncharacterized protein n=1 Tax=Saitozyma podzolica TaxID=1890683 RepID=A0A427YTN7_9TREE|nr:hypothetical protein EHS25_004250 [Saitozyma podzolica]